MRLWKTICKNKQNYKGDKVMLNAIKRALIVIIGVILQFGFAIVIRLFFYKYLGIITLFYNIVSILIIIEGKYKTFK